DGCGHAVTVTCVTLARRGCPRRPGTLAPAPEASAADMPHDVTAPPCRHRTPTGGIVDQCGPPAAARSRDGDRVDVGQRLKATAWAGRELVDRLARQSPARLAIVTFGGVILVFTGLLSL